MSNPYPQYKGMTFYAGVCNTKQSSGSRYGDGTVYRGVESKESETPTIDYQSEAADARMDSIMLLEHLKVAIKVLEKVAAEYVIAPPYLQGNLTELKQTARDYDHKLKGEDK